MYTQKKTCPTFFTIGNMLKDNMFQNVIQIFKTILQLWVLLEEMTIK